MKSDKEVCLCARCLGVVLVGAWACVCHFVGSSRTQRARAATSSSRGQLKPGSIHKTVFIWQNDSDI